MTQLTRCTACGSDLPAEPIVVYAGWVEKGTVEPMSAFCGWPCVQDFAAAQSGPPKADPTHPTWPRG